MTSSTGSVRVATATTYPRSSDDEVAICKEERSVKSVYTPFGLFFIMFGCRLEGVDVVVESGGAKC
jgi:hypothetical protein